MGIPMANRPRRNLLENQGGSIAEIVGGIAPSPLPDLPAPMLCTLIDTAFDGPGWTFEPKYDGLRVLARFDGRALTLLSRNNKSQEARFPEIAEGLRVALSSPAILDGEVVCLDQDG